MALKVPFYVREDVFVVECNVEISFLKSKKRLNMSREHRHVEGCVSSESQKRMSAHLFC